VRLIDRVWGNAEDGVTGAVWYRDLHADWSETKRAIFWSAFRNPTNNTRFWPLVNPKIDPRRIHYRGSFDAEQQARDTGAFAWTLTWQGVFAGLRLIVPVRGSLYRLWCGWKLRPSDRSGIFGERQKRASAIIPCAADILLDMKRENYPANAFAAFRRNSGVEVAHHRALQIVGAIG
jgi:hypothetical protein